MDQTRASQAQSNTCAAQLRAFTFCLNRSRFSVIVLIVGLALSLSDQGRDVLIANAEDDKTLRVAAAAAVWALSIWGWCRLLLDIRYDDPPSCTRSYNFWRVWMPRLLGALAFVVVAFSALQTEQVVLAVWNLGALAVFLVVVIGRRPAGRKMAEMLNKSTQGPLKAVARSLESEDISPDSVPPYENLREALGIPGKGFHLFRESWKLRGLIALAMFVTFLGLAALGNLAPVWLGFHTGGALILFFIWGATWLPLGSLISYTADKRGVPLLILLAAIALLSSYFNDNHEIRHAKDGKAVASRLSVTDALDTWGTANRTGGNEVTPFVVVAAAGGGIRAAYWTATVLGDLQDHAATLAQRTFALSGVSGGSVGATVYRCLLAIPPDQFRKSCPDGMMDCAQKILGYDFLGPLSAALLYPDLAQRFWPIPMFSDRATALERSWETAFRKVSGDDRLNTALGALDGSSWAPALFLNATWVDNGRRIVASNLRFAKNNPDEREAFIRSNDELAMLGYDLRLSTAAHNSARFPFVSPPGMWKHDDTISGRLQDGGLFENYGAETALEIFDLACRRFTCRPASHAAAGRERKRKHINPVVIMITSDPSLPEDLAESSQLKPITFGYEMRTTFTTYERVRSGRGAEAASRLKDWIERNHGSIFYFRMCPTDSAAVQPPLGWALSDASKQTIDSYLHGASKDRPQPPPCYMGNAAEFQRLVALLEM